MQKITQLTCFDCHAVHYYPDGDFIPFKCEDCKSNNIECMSFVR